MTKSDMIKNQNFVKYAMAIILPIFIFLFGLNFVDSIKLGAPPDEIPHISYINDAMNSLYWMPDYKSGKMIDSDGLNYLSHPPLYYTINAVVGSVFNFNPYQDFRIFRLISLVMVVAGLSFYLFAAILLNVSSFGLVVFGLSAFLVPNFVYIASSVNNDNLAFLSSGALFFSLSLFYSKNTKNLVLPALGVIASVFVISLTKANIALFAGSFILFWLVLTRFEFIKYFFTRPSLVLGVLLACVVVAYYFYTFKTYGKFFPYPKYVYDINPVYESIGVLEYLKTFFVLLVSRFSVAYGHVGYAVYSGIYLNIFYISIFIATVFFVCFRIFVSVAQADKKILPLFDALYLASFVLLLMHIVLGYQGYLLTGLIAAVQPRYYLFFLPVIWLPLHIYFSSFKLSKYSYYFYCLILFILLPIYLSLAPRNQAMSFAKDRLEINFKKINNQTDFFFDSKLPLTRQIAGSVDFVGYRNGSLIVEGWAFDQKNSLAPAHIHIFYNKTPFVVGGVSFARPDVAFALKNLNANFTGFRIKYVDLANSLKPCGISVLAEFPNGFYSILRDQSC